MIFFQQEGFEEYYKGILLGKNNQGLYIDPDCAEDVGKTEYYNLLTAFLRKQEMRYQERLLLNSNNMYRFLPPKEAKETSEFEKRNGLLDPKKIVVMEGNNIIFRLTSDQFGFSAFEKIYSDKTKCDKHPLSSLLSKNNDKDTIELITNYVKNSRTLGGAFVWPIKRDGRRACSYNMRRGVCSYIEDRVDLTLLEIKHALDGEYDRGKFRSDVLYNEYIKNDCIKTWLKHFRSFEDYCKYFMFDSFVENGMPISIISGSAIRENDVIEYKEKFLQSKRGQLQNLKASDLISVIKRMEQMIIKRTDSIEEILKPE